MNIGKNTEQDVGFMLTNKNGSYIFLREKPSSRYEGVFLFEDLDMYKFIEDINIKNNKIKKIKNYFYSVERERENGVTEKFFMPKNFTSLIYELDKESEIEIFLDCKDSYDNKEFGRHYEVFNEKGCIVVKFSKRTDQREDPSSGIEQYTLYLAIKAGSLNYKKIGNWVQRHYAFDESRNSKPYYRHVFHAMDIKAEKFVFSMAKDKGNAVKEAIYLFENLDMVKSEEKNTFGEKFLDNVKVNKIMKNNSMGNEIKIAYIAALNSLGNLAVNSKPGILAGLPWFFQFWSRDEAICLKALKNIDGHFAKELIFERLNAIQSDGRLPNIYYSENSTNADAIGWLFNRAFEFYGSIKGNIAILEELKKSISIIKSQKIKIKKIINMVDKLEKGIRAKEKENVSLRDKKASSLRKSIYGLIKNYSKNGLAYSNKKETWMDTEIGSGREGFNIEVQALALAMYKCAFEISQDKKYRILENVMKNNVLEKFWNNKILYDNLNDAAVRPNVFIAYYVYPELLPKKEWEVCFENTLKALWLDFGGLSTIDKKHRLFAKNHTGEDPKSYHNGDSWFWINNLVALALFRVNKNKFKNEIERIIRASTEDILWKGIIGTNSELSSAEKLKAEGCLSQAFSNAMFIELIDEIHSA